MPERTFIMIKPEHVELADKILEELDRYGTRVISAKVDAVPRDTIEEHYSPHKGKWFFDPMTNAYVEKSVVIAVYEGDNVIQRMMEVIGPTDPKKAGKETIRGKYGTDSLESAVAEKRPVQNVIHRSDCDSEAKREISVWQKYLEK
jgi:nucleoside-diphosphate kinase